MTDHNRTFDEQQDVESHAPYITLFFVLLNYTAMEYVYAKFHKSHTLVLYMVGVAVLLTIVTAIFAAFFHFRFNRKWVYLTMIPAVGLSVMPFPLLLGLLILAVTKATLVGLYFMHLKYEGNWVYYMLIPAGILACVFTTALYPDIGMQPTDEDQAIQEQPLSRAPSPSWSQPVRLLS